MYKNIDRAREAISKLSVNKDKLSIGAKKINYVIIMGYALKICKSVAGPDSGAGSRLPAAELQPAGRPVLHPPQPAQAPHPQYDRQPAQPLAYRYKDMRKNSQNSLFLLFIRMERGWTELAPRHQL